MPTRALPTSPAASGDARAVGEPPGRRELILDLLRHSPEPCSVQELAGQLRVHPNTVRFHLVALGRSGQVEQLLGDTTGPGRPSVLYRATHRMDPAGPTNYRLLATMLTSNLATGPEPAKTATELGRAWGPQLVPVPPNRRSHHSRRRRGEILTRMTEVLTDLGFAPEPLIGPRDTTIRLRHCPFLGLVTGAVETDTDRSDDRQSEDSAGYGDVICSLHLGLMQGVLTTLDSPVTVDRLEPFVRPDLCVAHLGRATQAPSRNRDDA